MDPASGTVLRQWFMYSTSQGEQSRRVRMVSTGTLYLGLGLPSPKQLSGQPGVDCLQTAYVNREAGALAVNRLCFAECPPIRTREANLEFGVLQLDVKDIRGCISA